MKKTRFNSIADLKTAAVVVVVLAHCMLFYSDNPFWPESADFTSPVVDFIYGIIDASILAGFVFSSGFLYALSLERKNGTIPQIIGERAKRLIVPYYIYGAVWLVPLYTLFDIKCFGREKGTGLLEGYRDMALGIFSDHLWFLWMLFWVSLAFALMKPLLKGKALPAAFCITVVLALVVQFVLADFPYFKLSQIAPYLLCYFAGIVVYEYREKTDELQTGTLFALAGLLLVVCCLYNRMAAASFALGWLGKLAGAFMMFFLFAGLERLKVFEKIRNTGFWRYTEAHSLRIYFLNCPVVYLGFRFLYPVIGQSAFLCILVNFLLSMAVIYAITALQDLVMAPFNRRQKG